MLEADDRGKYVIKKHTTMKEKRTNWDSHWQEVAEYIIPMKDNVFGAPTTGEKKGNKLFTSVSVQANEFLASALHGMMTNPNGVWFGLSTGDREIDKDVEVKAWLQEAVRIMISVMNQSNFQTQIHEVYLDLGSFGTSILRVLEDDELIVRFDARPVYEGYIEENHRGFIDTVSYEFKKTLKQIHQEFGDKVFEENTRLKEMLERDENQEVTVVHMVEPRPDHRPDMVLQTKLPFASYKVIKEYQITLEESGFRENPYIVTRWSKISGETYGRSPGMKALSDIKMANRLQKYILKGLEKTVDPPVQVPDDGVLLPVNLKSSGVNYYRAGTRDRIESIQTGSRPDVGSTFFKEIEFRIRQAFFIDQLQIPQADRMTATETMQRREEQLRTLGPILGRQYFELLRPLVNRVFSICARRDLFPPAPSIIQDQQLTVEYTSQIARAQQTAEIDNLTRVLNLSAPLAESHPEMMQNFDADEIVRDLSDRFGLPANYILAEDRLAELREAIAEAQAQDEELEATSQEADIVNKLGG